MFPPETIDQLQPIANLINMNKIQEAAKANLVIQDMEDSMDPSQYDNRKQTSIQHYLVKLLHRMVTATQREG